MIKEGRGRGKGNHSKSGNMEQGEMTCSKLKKEKRVSQKAVG